MFKVCNVFRDGLAKILERVDQLFKILRSPISVYADCFLDDVFIATFWDLEFKVASNSNRLWNKCSFGVRCYNLAFEATWFNRYCLCQFIRTHHQYIRHRPFSAHWLLLRKRLSAFTFTCKSAFGRTIKGTNLGLGMHIEKVRSFLIFM